MVQGSRCHRVSKHDDASSCLWFVNAARNNNATWNTQRNTQNTRYNALNSEHSTGSVSRYTPFTRYNRVERTTVVRSTGCQTGFQTGLTTGWMFVYTIQPVWQQVVSCKRGFSFCYVVLAAFSLRHVKFGVLIVIVKIIMSRPLIFSLFWRTKLANVLATSGSLPFYFSGFLFCCSDRTALQCASRFVCSWGLPGIMVTPTILLTLFFPNPSGSLIPRV